jgi:rhodanese-related sulfurtransferase
MDGEISCAELQSKLGDGDTPTVVDIRHPPAFNRGHIPGSINVPFPELANRVDELADADHVVTVCPHGKSSIQAARLVGSYEGADDATVESLAGGLSQWDGEIASEFDAGSADEGPSSPF